MIRTDLANAVLCWIATIAPNGAPNVSPKEIFAPYGAPSIVLFPEQSGKDRMKAASRTYGVRPADEQDA